MTAIQPVFFARSKPDRFENTKGAQVARRLLENTLDEAVEFYAKQFDAGTIRTGGTQWLRRHHTGQRLSVYRTTPTDTSKPGRPGNWEAILVADMDAPTKESNK